MPVTVDIAGGTCELREPSELRGRDRKLLSAAALAAASAIGKLPADLTEGSSLDALALGFTFDEAMAMVTLREMVVVARLVSWTLDEPLPTAQTIGDLPGDLYEELVEKAGTAAMASLDFSPSSDPESPTSGSGDSAGPSTDAQPSQSTPRRRTAGASTATASSIPA